MEEKILWAKKAIVGLNEELKKIPTDHRYSYAAGYLQSIIEMLIDDKIEINYKEEEK